MTKKELAARRAINQRIAEQDALRRCAACRRELPKVGALFMLTPSGETIRYCGEDCRQDHVDALQTMEARR